MALVSKTFSQIITFTRASTATFFNSAGTLTSAAVDAPRFDYNPSTLAAQGLLIEEARTNLLLRSEEFNDAAWTKTNSSITANAATAPSGTVTADKLIEALDVNLVHQTTQSVTVVSLGTYTSSYYVKADTRTRARIAFLVGASGVTADANLAAGTITAASAFGGGSAVGSSIQAINNGWYRITVSGTGAAGTTGECRLELLDASGNRQYNGDGTSGLFLWGAQLEAGAFPTSYIPTTTTALTRSADVASVNTLSPWYSQPAGTVYAEFAPAFQGSASAAANNPGVWGATQNSLGSFNGYGVRLVPNSNFGDNINGISRYAPSGFNTQVSVGQLAFLTLGQTYKTAFAWDSSGIAGSRDGQAAVTNTNPAAAAMGAHDQLYLGRQNVGGVPTQLSGWLRRITYYPRRLSNAELVSITS
jgi:hypothetical protein